MQRKKSDKTKICPLNLFTLNPIIFVLACGHVQTLSSEVGYIYPPMLELNGLFYYESFLNCSWIIKVDASHVLFTVYITDIEPSLNCSKDYLKVCVLITQHKFL